MVCFAAIKQENVYENLQKITGKQGKMIFSCSCDVIFNFFNFGGITWTSRCYEIPGRSSTIKAKDNLQTKFWPIWLWNMQISGMDLDAVIDFIGRAFIYKQKLPWQLISQFA